LLTFALAFLQFVQAFGVTESGTFRLLPVVPLAVPRLGLPKDGDVVSEVGGFVDDEGFVEDEGWTSCMD
jgi:hypothetical protein